MAKIYDLLVILLVFVSFEGFAKDKNAKSAVEMVSYEQRWLDDKGTIALKNNTKENVRNVTFLLEYLDMNGNPMDYETYSYDVDIAPGMTKKLDIPAYENERLYAYYKSEGASSHPKFKLRYEFKEYNSPKDSIRTQNDSKSDYYRAIFILVGSLLFLSIYIGLYVLVAVMAQRRNRSAAIWLLLSFVATPVLICIILQCIGYNENGEYKCLLPILNRKLFFRG
ncbi:MAG: hypothetical protein NC127_04175 [Muribaculum sp.]|nr:hypothetical protein [Muribaculum sp.]